MKNKKALALGITTVMMLSGCNSNAVEDNTETGSVTTYTGSHGDIFSKVETSTSYTPADTSHQNIIEIIEGDPTEIENTEEIEDNTVKLNGFTNYNLDFDKLEKVDCEGVDQATIGFITMYGREWSTVLSIFCDICNTNDIDRRELTKTQGFRYAEDYMYTVINLDYNNGTISVAIKNGIDEVKYKIEENR